MVTWPSKMLVCARYFRWCSIMPSDFSISTLKKVLKQAGISKSPRPVFPFESHEVEANDQYFQARGIVVYAQGFSPQPKHGSKRKNMTISKKGRPDILHHRKHTIEMNSSTGFP